MNMIHIVRNQALEGKIVPFPTNIGDSKILFFEAVTPGKGTEYPATVQWKQPEPIDNLDPQFFPTWDGINNKGITI